MTTLGVGVELVGALAGAVSCLPQATITDSISRIGTSLGTKRTVCIVKTSSSVNKGCYGLFCVLSKHSAYYSFPCLYTSALFSFASIQSMICNMRFFLYDGKRLGRRQSAFLAFGRKESFPSFFFSSKRSPKPSFRVSLSCYLAFLQEPRDQQTSHKQHQRQKQRPWINCRDGKTPRENIVDI